MELFAADGHDAGGCERVTGKSGMRPVQHGLDGGILRNKGRFQLDVSLHTSSMTRKPAGDKLVQGSVLINILSSDDRRAYHEWKDTYYETLVEMP